jgi:putative membrane protein
MGFDTGGMEVVYMLIFWVIVILVAVWMLGRIFPGAADDAVSGHTEQTGGPEQSAREILQRRYARGEITRAEYEQIKRDLGG